MNVVAFNGSARKDSNTAILVNTVFAELKKEGIRTELVQLAGTEIRGCTACGTCFENQDKRCGKKDDIVNDCIEKMLDAEGIILASPTYFADVSTEMKALIDRAGLAKANQDMFRRKVGASVVAVRRAGAIHAFDTMNHFFFISQMVVPGSSYWNIGIGGLGPEEVKGDEEGLMTMQTLGANMAWLMKKIND